MLYATRPSPLIPVPWWTSCRQIDGAPLPAHHQSKKKKGKKNSFGSPWPSCWDPGAIPLQLQIAPWGRRRFHLFFCPLFLAKKLDRIAPWTPPSLIE
jgi:hypothetical protein